MNKKFKVLIFSISVLSGIAAVNINSDKLFEISKNLEIFISVYRELNTNFVDELDPGSMMRKAIDAMTQTLDPYTNFVSESQIESYWINEDEKYQGIGAKVALVENKLKVIEPFEGGPAIKAGLKAGDQIVGIDGINIENKKLDEINAILRGLPGTDLKLKIIPNGKSTPEDKSLVRGEVNIPNVPYSGFVTDDVGYISLTVFTNNASTNISKALKELKEKNPNMSGVILDLRQNGGGLLHEAVNICNLFVPQGEVVVTTKGKVKERDQTYKTLVPPLDLDLPLAVLIDKRSASASEIVSGVIQDMDRGVLIGQRSFGKGLVQNTKELPYNARLKLTISKYYIPSGRCIQGVEYENGEPKDIPDSQRSKFKTKNGRLVLDGGGVTPDVKTEARSLLPVTQALIDKYVIYEFANEYCKNKDSIEKVGTFEFKDFDAFSKYTKNKGFEYELPEEKHLKEAIKSLEASANKSAIGEIQQTLERIKTSKTNDFNLAKEQIIDELEKEIITRYYHQKGKVMQTLDDDADVKKAIEILRDSKKYKNILSTK
ncbi:MAG: S41 family peptidase [Saprospiraceae bacterium]|nr:S41 family peptidase [Saprospiraceae bacterium]MBK9563939.1 S41 family peptidase [Saprospiraceae bacterium]